MLKSQIIILVIAIIAVIFLFRQPKFIVNDQRKTEKRQEVHSDPQPVSEDVHESNISPKEKEKLEILRKSFLSVSDIEKKLNFADSLSVLYKRLNEFDSSAKYKGEIALLKPVKENLVKAGEAYFDAASFAVDQKKGKLLGVKSRSYFQKAGELDPKNLEIQAKVAKTYAVAPDSTNPMKHIVLLHEIVAKDPSNREALMNLGAFAIKVGKFDNAIERFETLLKSDPENAEAEYYLGYSYMMAEKKDQAKAAFERAKKKSNDPALQSSVDEYLKELNK